MLFDNLAGAIFSTQEVILFYTIAFIVLGAVLGLVIFLCKKLLSRSLTHNNTKLSTSMLIGITALAVIIVLFFVVPTIIRDNLQRSKQQQCAEEAGYASPADDNSGKATAESQAAYRNCLGY